ncbi:MAG: hypothetical protein LIO46_02325, partial [Clostridiales bacterium]|nr:hypothetical protein [Clostridiales bacterium]
MDQQELNIRMHHKDEDGNVSILHPITDLKNVNGLEDALGGVHDAIDGINAQSGLGIGMAGTGEHAEVFNDYENNTASGEYAHAEGGASQAGGKYSHAEGCDCQATGNYSHAEGSHTESANDCAHAEGVSTIASGLSAHAEGHSTIAKGNYSHTEGRESVAEHLYAHVEGRNTKSSADYQHVQGKYNATSGTGNMAHIVGNGEDGDSRSNAHTLDWDGNAWFAGDVTSGEDISLAKTHERERALNQVVQPEDSIYETAGKPS